MTETQSEQQRYMKEQVMVLAQCAANCAESGVAASCIYIEAVKAVQQVLAPINQDLDYAKLHDYLRETMNHLSSLVDKSGPGGWIADSSCVYRVEADGQGYRNVDMLMVQMTDRDYHGTDGNHRRAREIARALNAIYTEPRFIQSGVERGNEQSKKNRW